MIPGKIEKVEILGISKANYKIFNKILDQNTRILSQNEKLIVSIGCMLYVKSDKKGDREK